MIPIVAIVGRPNVGKSTLFNRLIGQRKALVLDEPGITRDRNYGRAEHFGRTFTVIDTGGFDPESDEGMLPLMREQAQLAVEEADVTLFLVDGRSGLTTVDEQVHAVLRQSKKPVLVCVNKIDGHKQSDDVMEFYALGVDELWPISAEHSAGVADLLEKIVNVLPPAEFDEDDEHRIRIAVVGRPNAGKSTLINRLLGKERLIVSSVAGTTRDSIDTEFEYGEKRYTLIDTVGMRRRRGISLAVEKFGVIKAIQSMERSHVVVLVVDAKDGFSDQDARIANMALKRGRALVIAMNKWDVVDKDHRTAQLLQEDFVQHRASMSFVPMVFISALTGKRAIKVLELIDQAAENWRRRIPTAAINSWFQGAISRRPPPLYKKRAVKVYYVTQARAAPPTFVLVSNMPPDGFPVAYERYLTNQLRETFDFAASPLRLTIRQRSSKYRPDPRPKAERGINKPGKHTG